MFSVSAKSKAKRIAAIAAFIASLSTFSGISIFGGISGSSAFMYLRSYFGKADVEVTSNKVDRSLPDARQTSVGHSTADADPQACARLAQIVADATDQGFLLKAEQSEQTMKTLNCATTAGR